MIRNCVCEQNKKAKTSKVLLTPMYPFHLTCRAFDVEICAGRMWTWNFLILAIEDKPYNSLSYRTPPCEPLKTSSAIGISTYPL
jgi:hypothetical protein